MKDYKQRGDVIDYTVGEDAVSAGDPVIIEDLAGVAASDGTEGDVISVNLTGVFDLPKVATAQTKGAEAYWTGSAVTATATDNDLLGWFFEDAASGDGFVAVKLKQ